MPTNESINLPPSTAAQGIPHADDPPVYFNGVAVALAVGDVLITLSRNGKPILTLNTSYSVAKSLGEGLAKTISKFKEISGQDTLSAEELMLRIVPHTKK